MSADLNGDRYGPDSAGGLDSFRVHFENLPGPAYIWRRIDETFELVDFNRPARALLIANPSRALGARADAWYGDRPDIIEDFARCISTGHAHTREMEYTFTSGATRQLRVTYVPVPSSHVIVHTEDITDRIEERRRLAEAEIRARALLQANPDLVLRLDDKGRFLDWHAPDESVLAFRPEEFIGRTVAEVFDPEHAEVSSRKMRAALDSQQMQYWEYQLAVGGETRDFEARFVPSGKHEIVVTIRDITTQARLEREVILSRERERVRIGRDLHDGIGQTLTGISLQLGALAKRLDAERSPHAATLKELTGSVQSSIDELRRISRRLSPNVSSTHGLSVALEQLVDEFRNYPELNCDLHVAPGSDIRDEEVATHLFRIAQEAVSNALKHAAAEQIEVRLYRRVRATVLEILDDGVGIPPEPRRRHGIGIRNMQYRAQAVGATLTVERRTARGTMVRCVLPDSAG